jgi:predicted helicase
LHFVEEAEVGTTRKTFAPIDLLDYIYAVLHSPNYREKYKEFLKIDFPRIPYPEDAKQFRTLSTLGGKLRRLHLLDGVEPQEGTADYPVPGNDEVEKIQYDEADRKVFINKKQFFDNVPREAWEFYIGGYQVAQKWLKDRKGRVLSYDETLHYRRIITVLLKTIEIMEEIRFII